MTEDGLERALARVVAALPGGGEPRPGQLTMASAIADGIATKRHVVVQAGTGTGKSLAYLVPAILSGRKVVVATATKALQDQLAGKDLPFLQAHLDVEFAVAVVKGRSNYFCRQRAAEVSGAGDGRLLLDTDGAGDDGSAAQLGALGQEIVRLLDFGKTSVTGDRSELDFEPRPAAWAQVSVNAMDCPGAARCPSGEVCFAEFARQRAEIADVVVVNTHLYGTHLASGGFVLPEHDVVVFDEAHELEDVASSSLGLELGSGRFTNLARTVRAITTEAALADDLVRTGDRLDQVLAPLVGKRLPHGLGEEVRGVVELASERVRRATSAIRAVDGSDHEPRKARGLQAAGHLSGDLSFLAGLDETKVAWVEGRTHAPILKCAPIDVGSELAIRLWPNVTAVLTSATIPLHLTERLGIDADQRTVLDVGSPFEYETQAVLYCAAHLPDPRKPGYEEAMHEELGALIAAAGGRTLALFTSWRAMTAAAEALKDALPGRLLTQSELPKPALVKAFAEDEKSSLFATMGFWQGVDVPGRACSQVVIDRLPFPRPDEPLLQARRDRAGSAAFRLIDLPRAATLLAQGAGRLIRSRHDRGVVAVLDARLATAGYRWDLVRALPPMKRTKDRAVVEAFLRDLALDLDGPARN